MQTRRPFSGLGHGETDLDRRGALWLKGIGEFIGEQSPSAALKITEGIFEKSQMLIERPEIGFRLQEIENRNVRELIYGHYRIIYEISPDDVVYVLVVFHGAMDIDRIQF